VIGTGTSVLADDAMAMAQREFETNTLGPLAMSRAFAPVLGVNGGGAIVNVLSVLSWFSAPAARSGDLAQLHPALRPDLGTAVLGSPFRLRTQRAAPPPVAQPSGTRALMRYADCPTVAVATDVAATPAAVWALVSDIGLSSRFSTEVSGAEWLDGATGPALDARFVGHSTHDAIGEWSTTCIVTAFEPERVFEWSVIGRDGDVSSIWRYTITGGGHGPLHLESWFQMGPGRGGLNFAIERMPDKEERIVARRLEEHRVNMERVLAGVKEIAEAEATTA
jgi:hypothetical protein